MKEGFEVAATSEPKEAVPLILSRRFRVLLLDLNMPGLSGGDLLAVLRNLPAFDQLTVIILSSADEDKMRKVAAEHGAEYLSKSASKDELVAAVRDALDS